LIILNFNITFSYNETGWLGVIHVKSPWGDGCWLTFLVQDDWLCLNDVLLVEMIDTRNPLNANLAKSM
jgi:hypothetical protein